MGSALNDIAASQLAAVSASAARLNRARAHVGRLDAHAAEIRARLDALAGGDGAGPLRGEGMEVDRQRRQAAAALAGIEAEHTRHADDLAALYGSEGQARAALAEAHRARDAVKAEADAAKAVLERASDHARGVEARLAIAQAGEARHDAEAADRLHAALRDGLDTPTAAEPLTRLSPGLEDDLRAASAAQARAASDHRAKAAALAEAERRVRGAADAVMLAEADAMAREVAALDARTDLLRTRLTTYAARTKGDHVAPPEPPRVLNPGGWYESAGLAQPAPRVASSPAIAAALVDRTYVREAPRDMLRETGAWDAFASALVHDAGSLPDFPPDSSPPLPPAVTGVRHLASFEPRPAA